MIQNMQLSTMTYVCWNNKVYHPSVCLCVIFKSHDLVTHIRPTPTLGVYKRHPHQKAPVYLFCNRVTKHHSSVLKTV